MHNDYRYSVDDVDSIENVPSRLHCSFLWGWVERIELQYIVAHFLTESTSCESSVVSVSTTLGVDMDRSDDASNAIEMTTRSVY